MKHERWIIGSEFDAALLANVRLLLLTLGYKEVDFWNGIGGSQEISHWEYNRANDRLSLETETYIGLTLEGPGSLVTKVREAFQTSQDRKPFSDES